MPAVLSPFLPAAATHGRRSRHGPVAWPCRREMSGPVHARDLAITYPSLTPDLPAEAAGLAEVDGDDTLVTVAATLGASLAVVRDEDGRLLGGITTSRLIRQLLGAP